VPAVVTGAGIIGNQLLLHVLPELNAPGCQSGGALPVFMTPDEQSVAVTLNQLHVRLLSVGQ
jgi:hypothetical protein